MKHEKFYRGFPGAGAVSASICALTFLLLPGEIRAENLSSFEGAFLFVGGERELNLTKSRIQETVSGMNVLLRPFGYRVLSRAARTPERVIIDAEGENLSIAFPPWPARTTKLNGERTSFRSVKGSVLKMKRVRMGRRIVETVFLEKGRRILIYSFDGDSHDLVVAWRFESPRYFPQPLTYSLSYQRQGRVGS